MPENVKRVMISSTAIDLPEHREQAINACLRMDTKPEAMEHLPAADKDAIEVSLGMVDKADIYIGIYAWRYGYVPKGHGGKSITEMEFDRAVERGIPILIFQIHKDHDIKIEMVETKTTAQKKLKTFKNRASKDRGRLEFKSPADLRGHIVHSLGQLLKEIEAEESAAAEGEEAKPKAPRFHRISTIPQAPEPYIAHPYTLLQTKDIVGRQNELRLLTEWVTEPNFSSIRLFNIVAIGGMGKSALTWKWFQEIAPQELRGKIDGRMWWSFYESDAHFENFIIRALAYVSGQPEEHVRKEIKPGEREDQLLRILDEKPFLLALDGLERILIAYARMDAARMLDDDLDEETANRIYEAQGIPEDVRETYLAKHRLRMTADPRVGHFLRRLTKVRASRILITTRLYPADIQTQTAQPFPGCHAEFLRGLSDDDALQLWREFGVSGSSQQLLSLFRSVENYPLLIRALAGEVAEFRPAPGDFDAWRAENPDFNPVQLELKNARTHILEYALQGLGESQLRVLHSIAAFSMPAAFETIRALHVGKDQACATDRDLDAVLTELEDRGLLGWDKVANRYDLHPIVRGVVWDGVDEGARNRIYTSLEGYFEAAPKPEKWQDVEGLEDLTPAIELFRSLIGLERYQDAFQVFRDHLEYAIYFRLSASRQVVEILELLFPDGETEPPRLSSLWAQSFVINAMAVAYDYVGEPERALSGYRRALIGVESESDQRNAAVAWCNYSDALKGAGHLNEACRAALKGLALSQALRNQFREAVGLHWLGDSLAVCGVSIDSKLALRRAIKSQAKGSYSSAEAHSTARLAQRALLFDDPAQAQDLALRAWDLAHKQRVERDLIMAVRLQGTAALELGDFVAATERLHYALTRARAVNFVQEELPALTALAELHRRQGDLDKAREHLDAVWEPALRGPYPLFHADARNVLARIEIDAGNHAAAVEAATRAYELAWCDGPPYAYAYGLKHAQQLLEQLGAPEPNLPPFDESKFEPLPDVEINPKDEYWVDPDSLDSASST